MGTTEHPLVGQSVENRSITKVLAEAVVLHQGWEMDNRAWAVEFTDGSRAVLMTSHGSLYSVTDEGLRRKLEETRQSVVELEKLLKYL